MMVYFKKLVPVWSNYETMDISQKMNFDELFSVKVYNLRCEAQCLGCKMGQVSWYNPTI